jgi:hypothetical protein
MELLKVSKCELEAKLVEARGSPERQAANDEKYEERGA